MKFDKGVCGSAMRHEVLVAKFTLRTHNPYLPNLFRRASKRHVATIIFRLPKAPSRKKPIVLAEIVADKESKGIRQEECLVGFLTTA